MGLEYCIITALPLGVALLCLVHCLLSVQMRHGDMGMYIMCACEIKQLHNVSVLSVNLVGENGGPEWEIILFFNCMSRFMITIMRKKKTL